MVAINAPIAGCPNILVDMPIFEEPTTYCVTWWFIHQHILVLRESQ